MVKVKDVNIKIDIVVPKTDIIVDSKIKTTQGLCDKCNKRIKYNYVTVDDNIKLWIVRCSCGFLNISEAK